MPYICYRARKPARKPARVRGSDARVALAQDAISSLPRVDDEEERDQARDRPCIGTFAADDRWIRLERSVQSF
jgi:hypothetical protein